MKTVNATSFCKQASCPSAAMLLSYREFELESEANASVTQHLEICEFCCAELQLLAAYPQSTDEYSVDVAIPIPLRRLAEEIFAGSLLTAEMFSEVSFEKARLTFTDA
jgi:hypothetical protein